MKAKLKLNLLDLLLLLTLVFSITSYIFAKAEKSSITKIIEGKGEIAIEVILPDIYSTDQKSLSDFFKVGKKTGITIRNRPYTKLTIIKSESKPKMTVIPGLSGSHKVIEDPTKTNIKDYFITLTDIALKTSDGYVIGGNKIKTGNPIEIEGFNYRLNGKVTNIYPLNE